MNFFRGNNNDDNKKPSVNKIKISFPGKGGPYKKVINYEKDAKISQVIDTIKNKLVSKDCMQEDHEITHLKFRDTLLYPEFLIKSTLATEYDGKNALDIDYVISTKPKSTASHRTLQYPKVPDFQAYGNNSGMVPNPYNRPSQQYGQMQPDGTQHPNFQNSGNCNRPNPAQEWKPPIATSNNLSGVSRPKITPQIQPVGQQQQKPQQQKPQQQKPQQQKPQQQKPQQQNLQPINYQRPKYEHLNPQDNTFMTKSNTKAPLFILKTIEAESKLKLNPKQTVSEHEETIRKHYLSDDVTILCFPGGSFADKTYHEFKERNNNTDKFMYYVSFVSKSKIDLNDKQEHHVRLSTCNELLGDCYDPKYPQLICCFLKYIAENFYHSINIIMSLRKRFAFPPLHANLYKLYKKGKVTNKSLGVITSSLKKIAPTVKQLLELIAFMSISKTDNGINIRDIINTDFVDVFDLIDTKEPDLTEVKIFEDYSCLPFCQLSPFTLLQRNQPFIFFSIDEYNLLLNYSHPNKFKIYSPSMKKDNIIDMVDLFMQFDIKDIINLKFAQATYIVADTSGSMLSSFNETGIHKGEIAIDAINKFGETSIQLKVLDPLMFKDNFIDLPLKYDEKMFDGKSPIWDKIHRAGTTMIELAKEIPKRIFIITDGEDTLSKMEKDKVISFLRRNNIILDALILEEDLELTSDLRTICHLSGGASFTPSSIEEVNEFVTLESFIDLSQRTIHQINHIELENINKAQFENISKKIRCSKITSLHPKRTNFYKELILLSPYSQNDIKLSFRHKRINKEMNICINYLKYLIEKKKRPTFSFYYIYSQNNNEIDIGKWCVFIEKEVSDGRKLVFQVAVEFPPVYPMGIPKFRLLSNIQMNNVMSHGTINFDFEYKPNTRILELLFQIRDMLTLNGEFPERNELDEYDFIESIEEVESVFLFGNKKASDEVIAFEMKNKYKELFKQ